MQSLLSLVCVPNLQLWAQADIVQTPAHQLQSSYTAVASCDSMSRPDYLKVFLGSLHNDVNKPKLLDLCRFFELSPFEVIVPPAKPDKLAIAFLVFNTPEEAHAAINLLNGLEDPSCSPEQIHVFRVANAGYLYDFRLLTY